MLGADRIGVSQKTGMVDVENNLPSNWVSAILINWSDLNGARTALCIISSSQPSQWHSTNIFYAKRNEPALSCKSSYPPRFLVKTTSPAAPPLRRTIAREPDGSSSSSDLRFFLRPRVTSLAPLGTRAVEEEGGGSIGRIAGMVSAESNLQPFATIIGRTFVLSAKSVFLSINS